MVFSLQFSLNSCSSIEPDQLLLVMGEYDLGRTTEPYGHIERTVQMTAMHPKFEPRTFEYDLALMRLVRFTFCLWYSLMVSYRTSLNLITLVIKIKV